MKNLKQNITFWKILYNVKKVTFTTIFTFGERKQQVLNYHNTLAVITSR